MASRIHDSIFVDPTQQSFQESTNRDSIDPID